MMVHFTRLEIEKAGRWGEKKLGSRPLVFEEFVGYWVRGVSPAVDYRYLILRKESWAWNMDGQRH